jgi:hypothetical protein
VRGQVQGAPTLTQREHATARRCAVWEGAVDMMMCSMLCARNG